MSTLSRHFSAVAGFGGRAGRLTLIGAAFAATLSTPALAEKLPETQLVRCGGESCLEVSGYRQNPQSIVAINGRQVVPNGEKSWRVVLSLDMVEAWSEEHARRILVTTTDTQTGEIRSSSARLPIGLLGNTTELAALEITLS